MQRRKGGGKPHGPEEAETPAGQGSVLVCNVHTGVSFKKQTLLYDPLAYFFYINSVRAVVHQTGGTHQRTQWPERSNGAYMRVLTAKCQRDGYSIVSGAPVSCLPRHIDIQKATEVPRIGIFALCFRMFSLSSYCSFYSYANSVM
ncbi:hypothetical protein BC832DRAFT_560565 [Gaertneriomyces semiglobifer]|nr:hypothetical protein BC832DRAFT_560565 [Gaertneriomyces semiglobifer]